MQKIPNINLHIGAEQDLAQNFENQEVAIVNVAGNLHTKILGTRPNSNHPNYILYKRDRILSVNFVDGEDPKYYDWQSDGVSVFTQILDFIKNQKGKKVLINCNQGISRSPSVTMVYLAKRLKSVSNKSFDSAMEDFVKLYPNYTPGLGIRLFLSQNWNNIK